MHVHPSVTETSAPIFMNVKTFVRQRVAFQDETAPENIAFTNNLFAFRDQPQFIYDTDQFYSRDDTSKVIFETQIKYLIDSSLIESKRPLVIIFGEQTAGKTFTVEGNTKDEQKYGLLHQTLTYLLMQQSTPQYACSLVGDDKLYDLSKTHF